MDAGAGETHEDTEFGRGLKQEVSVSLVAARVPGQKAGGWLRTHCGLGALQSTHLLLSFVFWISSNCK